MMKAVMVVMECVHPPGMVGSAGRAGRRRGRWRRDTAPPTSTSSLTELTMGSDVRVSQHSTLDRESPSYSPVMYPLSSDTARKTCREDGWFTHNGTLEEWTDFSGCDKTDDIVQMEYIRSATF